MGGSSSGNVGTAVSMEGTASEVVGGVEGRQRRRSSGSGGRGSTAGRRVAAQAVGSSEWEGAYPGRKPRSARQGAPP